MSGLLDKLIWFFANGDAHELVSPLVLPFAVAFGLYQSHYPWVVLRSLYHRAFGDGFVPFTAEDAPAAAVVIPTLLRNREDLDGLLVSLSSLARSGYQGTLVVVASIDGLGVAPALVAELRAFVAELELPPTTIVHITGHDGRMGKAMASDRGVRHVVALAARGEIPVKPTVFFNMDADCDVGTHTLDRMIRALLRPSRLTGRPGMIVTSHVSIREQNYFRGWRELLTARGLIAITVARDYLVSIGLGRTNVIRVMPQIGASGALYCTWMQVAETAPHWARFMGQLRVRDWLAWWLGAAPPRFEREAFAPMPEAMTGMADDTWMSWLAYVGRWDGDRIDFSLPPTPAHAAWHAFVSYFARPFRYDLRAKVYTTTPTTLGVLFKQRTRWNVSRIWAVQRWSGALLYHLSIGIPAFTEVVITSAFQVMVVIALILSPFAGPVPAMAPALFLLVEAGYVFERVLATLVAMLADRDEPGQWKKLLGLPFAGIFQFVFNVMATVRGFTLQVLGTGFNDGFAPEATLIAGGTSRIALSYRIGRFYALAWRSVTHGDVPLGWFWLGWRATPWTPNGYEGWSTGKRPPFVRIATDATASPSLAPVPALPEAAARLASLAAASPVPAGAVGAPGLDLDLDSDSGVRLRRPTSEAPKQAVA